MKAIDNNGKHISVNYSGGDIYASHDISGANPVKISADEIFNYSYIRTSHLESPQSNESSINYYIYIPYVVILVLMFVHILYVYLHYYRDQGYAVREIRFSDRDTAEDVMRTLYDDTRDQINDIRSWGDDDRNIKVKVFTDIKGGSYTVLVDDLICGHISPWKKEISLPAGSHSLIITTNDELNMLILKERVICQDISSIKVTETNGKLQASIEVREQ